MRKMKQFFCSIHSIGNVKTDLIGISVLTAIPMIHSIARYQANEKVQLKFALQGKNPLQYIRAAQAAIKNT